MTSPAVRFFHSIDGIGCDLLQIVPDVVGDRRSSHDRVPGPRRGQHGRAQEEVVEEPRCPQSGPSPTVHGLMILLPKIVAMVRDGLSIHSIQHI